MGTAALSSTAAAFLLASLTGVGDFVLITAASVAT
jgi:hypothetical protein